MFLNTGKENRGVSGEMCYSTHLCNIKQVRCDVRLKLVIHLVLQCMYEDVESS